MLNKRMKNILGINYKEYRKKKKLGIISTNFYCIIYCYLLMWSLLESYSINKTIKYIENFGYEIDYLNKKEAKKLFENINWDKYKTEFNNNFIMYDCEKKIKACKTTINISLLSYVDLEDENLINKSFTIKWQIF